MQKDILALALILNGCVQTFLQRSSNSIHRTSLPLCQHTRSHSLDTYHWLVLANIQVSEVHAGGRLRSLCLVRAEPSYPKFVIQVSLIIIHCVASAATATGDSMVLSSTARLSGKLR